MLFRSVSNSWIRWLQQVNRDWVSWKMSVAELKEAELEAFQHYQAVLVEALRHWQTFVESLVVAKAADSNFSTVGHLWLLLRREEQHVMARQLHVLSWKGGRGMLTSLSKVTQSDQGLQMVVLTGKDKIKEAPWKSMSSIYTRLRACH